jgi:hypothetical protein
VTLDRVREQSIAWAIGYLAGLALLLVWPDRDAASQLAILLAGTATAILVGVGIEWKAFHRSPLDGFIPPTLRPWRYSLPYAIGFFGGLLYLTNIRDREPAWGLTAYAVGLALVLAGLFLSDLWWVMATRHRTLG